MSLLNQIALAASIICLSSIAAWVVLLRKDRFEAAVFFGHIAFYSLIAWLVLSLRYWG
jgi:hypothetical protein